MKPGQTSTTTSAPNVTIRRALLSVFDKSGLAELGKALVSRGVELISTGGTARVLRDAGLDVKDVSDVTAFPEMMDGRVKTLHPMIHGGLLALRDNDAHVASMKEHDIGAIDLVVCNLYPFAETVKREGATFPEIIEQIDIGGPSMVRSAAKNHRFVSIVTRADQYEALLNQLEAHDGATTGEFRCALALQAFAETAAYDGAIARWFASQDEVDGLPRSMGPSYRTSVLRYGENPHQKGAVYVDPLAPTGSLAKAEVLGGKALSFNNLGDVDSAWALVREFDGPACAVIKHGNPCGAAVSDSIDEAYDAAMACDPRSAFGGIVALNRPLSPALAKTMAVPERFLEVLIAPGIDAGAADVFLAKGAPKWGKNLRILDAKTAGSDPHGLDVRSIDGGFLVQERDDTVYVGGKPETATKRAPTADETRDLDLAFRVCKHVRSNAIVLALGGRAIGVGAGQMSRVEATEIAVLRAERYAAEAGITLDGMVVASDAFYPFNDAIELALDAGAKAVIQPGGSRNDKRAIELCDKRGIAMQFTKTRHFRH